MRWAPQIVYTEDDYQFAAVIHLAGDEVSCVIVTVDYSPLATYLPVQLCLATSPRVFQPH
jgi:hypothetical protein